MNKAQIRVISFKDMKDGWGGSKSDAAPSHEVCDKVAVMLGELSVPLPRTYPSYQGGVRFEWDASNDGAIEVDFFNDKSVYITSINTVHDNELDLQLEDPKLLKTIEDFYKEHV